MCITIFCFSGCDVINFKINLTILIKSRQKFKYLEDKKSFQSEIKSIFDHFSRAFSCQKILRPEIGPLTMLAINPLSAKFIKWSNTLKQIVGKLPTISLGAFDHFSGLAFKGLKENFCVISQKL